MSTIAVRMLPGTGIASRAAVLLRRIFSRRALLRLSGVTVVTLAGRVYPVRPVPLRVARDLVPAIVRASKAFAAWEFNEALFDDIVRVLALGLGASHKQIESLPVSLFELAPVIEAIAKINGLPVVEAGRADLGKLLAALNTGTNSTQESSAPPAGPGAPSMS